MRQVAAVLLSLGAGMLTACGGSHSTAQPAEPDPAAQINYVQVHVSTFSDASDADLERIMKAQCRLWLFGGKSEPTVSDMENAAAFIKVTYGLSAVESGQFFTAAAKGFCPEATSAALAYAKTVND